MKIKIRVWVFLFALQLLNAETGHAASAAKSVVQAVSSAVVQVYNYTVSATVHALSVLNVINCTNGNVYGIPTQCFDAAQNQKLSAALARLAASKYYTVYRGSYSNPYSATVNRTRAMINGSSKNIQVTYAAYSVMPDSCLSGGNWYGCDYYGTTFLTNVGMSLSRINLAAVLLHESDHSNGRTHNCGGTADADLQGPYGFEASYMMSQYLSLPSSDPEKWDAYTRAIGIANYQLCNSAANRDAMINYKQGPAI